MNTEILIGLTGFAFVSSITPGPNNLMLMASGANFGFWRSIPHMLGILLGFTLMVFLVGLGLAQVFDAYPVLHDVLKVVSVVYMGWLAWKIANAAPPKKGEAAGTPMTFLQAAAFQWVNPKAWAMALTAVTVYSLGTSLQLADGGAVDRLALPRAFGLSARQVAPFRTARPLRCRRRPETCRPPSWCPPCQTRYRACRLRSHPPYRSRIFGERPAPRW